MKIGDIEYLDWEPRAVTCSRGNIRTGMTFDAEVKFLDKQYHIRSGYGDRDEAMVAANVIVELLKTKIREASKEVLAGLKEAKP